MFSLSTCHSDTCVVYLCLLQEKVVIDLNIFLHQKKKKYGGGDRGRGECESVCRLNSCNILLLSYIDMSTEQPYANSSMEVICKEHELKEQGN